MAPWQVPQCIVSPSTERAADSHTAFMATAIGAQSIQSIARSAHHPAIRVTRFKAISRASASGPSAPAASERPLE